MLTRSFSVGAAVNSLLALSVMFPFIPRLLQSTDTQPTFLLLMGALLLVAFVSPASGRRAMHLSLTGLALVVTATLLLYAMLLAGSVIAPGATIVSRVVSFAQFSLAALWAYGTCHEWTPRFLYRVIAVYAAFTVVYFLTGGVVEDVLMRSRMESAESLFAGGRGARTLSPEPSFFALQVFTIFVLARITGAYDAMERGRRRIFVAMVAFCLLASFSAVGALLTLVLVSAAYPRSTLVGVVVAAIFFGALSPFLERWESIRAVRVLLAIVASGGSIAGLVLLDPSVASRVNSFAAYVREFQANPLTGNAFSLLEGGGFISIVAAFGVVALVFFLILLAAIITGRFRPGTKITLLAWFALNFVSGPIGTPIVGVIVGSVFRELSPQRRSSRARPTPAPVTVSA